MSVDVDTLAPELMAAPQDQTAAADHLQDSLSDPLADSGDDSVQMASPPPPGA